MTDRWRRVEEIVHYALARTPDERLPFVRDACGDDESLRAEVESLLANQSRADAVGTGLGIRDRGLGIGTEELIGRQIGVYRIDSLLGAGGMGEVYRARDAKLQRDVAIKVLPADIASDPERLARFQREARALASLNHPHIGAIHGFEESSGIAALVLELVEGPTLAERIDKGPVSMGDALKFARQIAEALDAAHEKGIIHRDLKPANIKLTADGQVKVLDFGLAKFAHSSNQSSAPATETLATREGAIFGTPSYMSPEQARGLPVDKRTDIWAFGCLMYEMLARRAAFPGTTVSDTLVAVLEREPDWSALPPQTPSAVRRLIQRCLQKDSRRRLHDIADVRLDIDEMLEAPSATSDRNLPGATTSMPFRRYGPHLLWASVVAILAALLAVRSFDSGRSPGEVVVHRLTDFAGLEEYPSLSPDGRSVAFTADKDGARQIWVRFLSGGSPLPITKDMADHLFPRWAPDSETIVYFSPAAHADSSGSLWEVSALGGSPRRIAGSLGGADVSRDGRRVAFFRLHNDRPELVVTARDGSALETVAALEAGFVYQTPRWSPDDRQIAFERRYFGQGGSIHLADVASKRVAAVLTAATPISGFAWLPTGRGLVLSSSRGSTIPYLPTSQLWSTEFDDGEWRQLTFGDGSYVHPDIGADGSIVASRLRTQTDVWRYPVDGSGEENMAGAGRVTRQTSDVRTPSMSPDNKEMAYLSDSGGHGNLWVLNLTDGASRQITFERDPNLAIGIPVWSPRGDRIVYYLHPQAATQPSMTGGYWQIVGTDGSNPRQLIPRGWWASWSPDGQWVYFQDLENTPSRLLKKIPADGGPPITVRSDGAVMPVVSPDGGTLFFAVAVPRSSGTTDYEIRFARPEDAPSQLLARIPAHRIGDGMFHPAISPAGDWLALPLTDGVTANIWGISTRDGTFRAITNFGHRPTFITRRVSWSADGKFVYAAVGEGDADVFLLAGLTQ